MAEKIQEGVTDAEHDLLVEIQNAAVAVARLAGNESAQGYSQAMHHAGQWVLLSIARRLEVEGAAFDYNFETRELKQLR